MRKYCALVSISQIEKYVERDVLMSRKTTPLKYDINSNDIIQGVNWNNIADSVDLDVWNRLVSNFWVPEKIPVSNDLSSWKNLTDEERRATLRVFVGLTVLDTIQGTVGAPSIMKDAQTAHEEAVYANISFMEALDKSMQVLTLNGWVSIADIKDDNLIAQYDPDNESMEFVPARVVEPHRAEKLYSFTPRGTTMIVSPGHRMYFEDEQGNSVVMEAQDVVSALNDGAQLYVRTTARKHTHAQQATFAFEEEMQRYIDGDRETSPLSDVSSAFLNTVDDSWMTSVIDIIDTTYDDVVWNEEDITTLQAWATVAGVCTHVEKSGDKYTIDFDSTRKVKLNVDDISVLPGDEVYCVTVPSTFIYVKHESIDASPVVTGNCIHAKSYSNIFMTLSSTEDINNIFRWADENEYIQRKAQTILGFYNDDDPFAKKIASTTLESFMFYSGFYLPLRMASRGRLNNTADIIRLIIRDESIHGYYIGYKYQSALSQLTHDEQEKYKDMAYELILDMYSVETPYAEQIYDELGWTEDVKNFLRYNANKALSNMGYEPLFPADSAEVSPGILASLSPQSDENHDFFSGSGSTYVIGDAEDTSDEDWQW